jgi:hypothetical protein
MRHLDVVYDCASLVIVTRRPFCLDCLTVEIKERFVPSTWIHPPGNTVSYPTRPESWGTTLWEPQMMQEIFAASEACGLYVCQAPGVRDTNDKNVEKFLFLYHSEIIFLLPKLNIFSTYIFFCFSYIIYSWGLQVLTRGINLWMRQLLNTAKFYFWCQSVPCTLLPIKGPYNYKQQNGNTKLTAAWHSSNSTILCKTKIFFRKFNFVR